jgi:hypothetical protein
MGEKNFPLLLVLVFEGKKKPKFGVLIFILALCIKKNGPTKLEAL